MDEIEKAHPELFNMLLQVMDHATLTDNNGKKADFRNVVLIMTTNAGAREMSEKVVGFGAAPRAPDVAGKSALERHLHAGVPQPPRRVVQFKGLSQEVILQVVDKEVRCASEPPRRQEGDAGALARARAWLGEQGLRPRLGRAPDGPPRGETPSRSPSPRRCSSAPLAAGGVARVDGEGRSDRARLHPGARRRGLTAAQCLAIVASVGARCVRPPTEGGRSMTTTGRRGWLLGLCAAAFARATRVEAQLSFGELPRLRGALLTFEQHVRWSAVSPGWVGQRPGWLLAVNTATHPGQLARQLLQLETQMGWGSVQPSWRQQRPGWVAAVRGAGTVNEVARLLLALEGATLWSAVTPAWRGARPGWVRQVQSLAQ
jgi:hypothetical protein